MRTGRVALRAEDAAAAGLDGGAQFAFARGSGVRARRRGAGGFRRPPFCPRQAVRLYGAADEGAVAVAARPGVGDPPAARSRSHAHCCPRVSRQARLLRAARRQLPGADHGSRGAQARSLARRIADRFRHRSDRFLETDGAQHGGHAGRSRPRAPRTRVAAGAARGPRPQARRSYRSSARTRAR